MPNKGSKPPALMDIRQAATYLNLGQQTVRDLARLGQIKGRKTSGKDRGHWRFERLELVKWAQNHTPAKLR